jgi:hypothetical protein
MALGLAVCLLPWGARNYLQLGTTKLTTTHGGYTLLLGNNPEFYAFLREADWGAIWDSRRLDRAWLRRDELAGPADDLFSLAGEPMTASVPPQPAMHRCTRTEIEDDQLAYALARRYIREDRPMFIWASLHRIASLWHLLPHATVTPEPTWRTLLRWSTAAWYGALFGLVVVGMVRLRGRLLRLPWLWGLLLTLTFTAVHAIYWSNLRMRAPLMPVLALVAAAAVASGPSRGERGRAETAPSSSADPD